MWYTGEIILESYLPLELEEGMLFVNRISVGVIEPYIELWQLEEIPEDMDLFLTTNGAPVKIYIIDTDNEILATEDEIGWMDEGEHTDELRDVTLDDINLILREYEGYLDIEIDDEDEDFLPIVIDGKVIISIYEEEI